jgi:hypothetical protein
LNDPIDGAVSENHQHAGANDKTYRTGTPISETAIHVQAERLRGMVEL